MINAKAASIFRRNVQFIYFSRGGLEGVWLAEVLEQKEGT
jgi:hypothetical protein